MTLPPLRTLKIQRFGNYANSFAHHQPIEPGEWGPENSSHDLVSIPTKAHNTPSRFSYFFETVSTTVCSKSNDGIPNACPASIRTRRSCLQRINLLLDAGHASVLSLQIPPAIDFCVTWIALSTSFWNPFIYWLLNARFRKICKDLLTSKVWYIWNENFYLRFYNSNVGVVTDEWFYL